MEGDGGSRQEQRAGQEENLIVPRKIPPEGQQSLGPAPAGRLEDERREEAEEPEEHEAVCSRSQNPGGGQQPEDGGIRECAEHLALEQQATLLVKNGLEIE